MLVDGVQSALSLAAVVSPGAMVTSGLGGHFGRGLGARSLNRSQDRGLLQVRPSGFKVSR